MLMVGLLGCGAQELSGGSRDAGRDRPVIDATGRNLDDAGCPPEGKMTCGPYGCPGSDIFATPECINGVWSCPIPLRDLICPVDSAMSVADGGHATGDAAASCPPTLVEDGGHILSCAYAGCRGDTGVNPVCSGGAWICPAGAVDTRTCPVEYCTSLLPPGCTCNPADGVLTCRHDAGADAPPLPAGIGSG
jgi:hypothetical protein